MLPSKHSGSSRSAHKDSDQIATDSNYTLGDYSFRIERSSVPGSTNDKIEAVCTKGGKNARKSIQVPSSAQINGWYVDANGTTADVYAEVTYHSESPIHEQINSTVLSGEIQTGTDGSWDYYYSSDSPVKIAIVNGNYVGVTDLVLPMAVFWLSARWSGGGGGTGARGYQYTYAGKTVNYGSLAYPLRSNAENSFGIIPINSLSGNYSVAQIAWAMAYGQEEAENKPVLIGRFAIELEDAGGVGPGSDWIDPGDYDPDWEEGDPTHTLYVEVTGALSGRHNDPIVDPSYSYIPADKETVKDYGCGGDGGHGGGGGAGASTVVVHKFATNQANYKEVTAIARRHGYGSGGGKGGKGGDGCILVYY